MDGKKVLQQLASYKAMMSQSLTRRLLMLQGLTMPFGVAVPSRNTPTSGDCTQSGVPDRFNT